jgi:hypothetical protein
MGPRQALGPVAHRRGLVEAAEPEEEPGVRRQEADQRAVAGELDTEGGVRRQCPTRRFAGFDAFDQAAGEGAGERQKRALSELQSLISGLVGEPHRRAGVAHVVALGSVGDARPHGRALVPERACQASPACSQ